MCVFGVGGGASLKRFREQVGTGGTRKYDLIFDWTLHHTAARVALMFGMATYHKRNYDVKSGF